MSEELIQPQLTFEEAYKAYNSAVADYLELMKRVNERYSGFKRFYRKKLDENEIIIFQGCYKRFGDIIDSQSAKEELVAMKEGEILAHLFFTKA